MQLADRVESSRSLGDGCWLLECIKPVNSRQFSVADGKPGFVIYELLLTINQQLITRSCYLGKSSMKLMGRKTKDEGQI